MTTLSDVKGLMRNGNYNEADKQCDLLCEQYPDDKDIRELQRSIHEYIQVRDQPGPEYTEWLKWFHLRLKPRTYVEIGVESGKSLCHAIYPTRVIGIDPEPKIVHGYETWAKIFKMESNEFFLKKNLFEELGGDKVDLSFIDGLHYYDQALEDFMNVEKYSHKDTVIVLHDAYPVVASNATREWNTVYWAGDTWKMVPILAKYRPDLKIITIPSFPTGLIVVTNLDPESTVLADNFTKAVEEMKHADFKEYFNNPVNKISNNFSVVDRWL